MRKIESVVIIGSGNLAESLAQAIAESSISLVQIFARNQERGAEVARLSSTRHTDSPEELANADLYIAALSDRAVEGVMNSLPFPKGAIVAHTAGSVPIDSLPASLGGQAVIYPFQTFTKGRKVDFRSIPILLETSTPELFDVVEEFAKQLSTTTIVADSIMRQKVHLAGVFACNFTNYMYSLGESVVAQSGLDFEILKPLLLETAAKAAAAQSPSQVQTGPAIRNDEQVQQSHIDMLPRGGDITELYKLISKNIWETSKKI